MSGCRREGGGERKRVKQIFNSAVSALIHVSCIVILFRFSNLDLCQYDSMILKITKTSYRYEVGIGMGQCVRWCIAVANCLLLPKPAQCSIHYSNWSMPGFYVISILQSN